MLVIKKLVNQVYSINVKSDHRSKFSNLSTEGRGFKSHLGLGFSPSLRVS